MNEIKYNHLLNYLLILRPDTACKMKNKRFVLFTDVLGVFNSLIFNKKLFDRNYCYVVLARQETHEFPSKDSSAD